LPVIVVDVPPLQVTLHCRPWGQTIVEDADVVVPPLEPLPRLPMLLPFEEPLPPLLPSLPLDEPLPNPLESFEPQQPDAR